MLFVLLMFGTALLAQETGQSGVVVFSDGEKLEGEILTQGNKPLDVFDLSRKKRVKVSLSEVIRIDAVVESEEMVDAWMFIEESNHEKVKLPYKYPVRKLQLKIVLENGDTVTGHCTFVFYLKSGDEVKKFLVSQYQKGEKDQKLTDMVYVQSLQFKKEAKQSNKRSIQITVKDAQDVKLISLEKETTYDSPTKSGTDFLFHGVLKSAYCCFILAEKQILWGVPDGVETERDRFQKRVEEIEEFFNEKTVRGVYKSNGLFCALVEMKRTTPSHLKEENGSAPLFLRYELWTFVERIDKLEIRKRYYLWRFKIEADKKIPERSFVFRKELSTIKADEGLTKIILD